MTPVHRPLWQRFSLFLVPLMASNILQALSGTINNIYIGQLIGVDALAAVAAFFPVMFELTILFSAFTTLFGLLALMGLPRWNHPLFASKRFAKFSDDGFFVCIEARDPKFSQDGTKALLEKIGGKNIELVEDEI